VGPPIVLPDPLAFEWDDGNAEKNRARHGVLRSECEELFGAAPLLLFEDAAHSRSEPRWFALGRTRTGRGLYAVFTIRGSRIRIVSARDMSRKERRVYDAAIDQEGASPDSHDPDIP
jgi:uncharacterized DUF497 family protein